MSTNDVSRTVAILSFAGRVLRGELRDPVELSCALANLALDMAPVDQLKSALTDEARRRDDALVDVAEAVKLAGG